MGAHARNKKGWRPCLARQPLITHPALADPSLARPKYQKLNGLGINRLGEIVGG